MIRQGDLLFVKTDKIDDNAVEDATGVIARGEATGHTHRIRQKQRAVLLFAVGVAYVRALEACAIDHQEHKTVVLPAGDWIVKRQREYVPEGWRQVAD